MKKRCSDEDYLSKKSLVSNIKLAIYFGGILFAIALAWGSNTQKLEENSKDLQAILIELREHSTTQISMQRQVDIHEIKIVRIEDELKMADESATLK
jgi:hypothetical protein